jgi:hypothetical protein
VYTTRTKPDGEIDWNYEPKDINSLEFTFDQISSAWHLPGTAGQSWNLSVKINHTTYHEIHLSVTSWLNLVKHEMARLRQGESPQIYVALRKSKNYWVVASECIPPFPPNGLTYNQDNTRNNIYSRETVRNAIL